MRMKPWRVGGCTQKLRGHLGVLRGKLELSKRGRIDYSARRPCRGGGWRPSSGKHMESEEHQPIDVLSICIVYGIEYVIVFS